jgi:hypothetical protein
MRCFKFFCEAALAGWGKIFDKFCVQQRSQKSQEASKSGANKRKRLPFL